MDGRAHIPGRFAVDWVPLDAAGRHADRDNTLASFERFKQLATDERATVIIQHEPGDIDKLPAFPASARR